MFCFNALLIASNGTESRVGSLTADWERFFEWKRIEREDEPRKVSLETVIRGTSDQTRLLDLVENFTLFSELKSGLTKVIGQNHQFLGVNNAVAATVEAREAGHVRRMLDRLIRLNRTRVDFLERFEELIDEYNSGSKNIEQLFEELLQLSRSLTEEQERHVRENVSEEELVIFDILTRPGPELTAVEREQVKKVARHLLERLKSLLVLDWRKRAGSLAQTRLTIEDALDDGLPRAYTPEVYQQKCAAIFEHLFESYQGEGRSLYADAG